MGVSGPGDMFWFGILIICLFLSLSHSFPHRILFFKKQNLVVVTEQVGSLPPPH